MSFELSVSRLIGKYGQEVEITGNPVIHTCAFIQPLGWRSKTFIGGEYTKIGFVGGQQYLYIGPAEHSIARRIDDILETERTAYRILRARDVYFRGRAVYCLGILCEYTLPYPEAVQA